MNLTDHLTPEALDGLDEHAHAAILALATAAELMRRPAHGLAVYRTLAAYEHAVFANIQTAAAALDARAEARAALNLRGGP